MKDKSSLKPVALGAAFAVVLVIAIAAALPRSIGNNRPAAPPAAQAQQTLPLTKVRVPAGKQAATFAAGCFWSMEAIFKQLKGVESVVPGYAGGYVANPSYESVEFSNTGHAETIEIVFDPLVISYRELLDVLLTVRNPTTLNQQGPDRGPQYRSVIFFHNSAQQQAAQEAIRDIAARHIWDGDIVTEIAPFKNFYRAEDYHLDYYNRHPDEPYCRTVVKPEIEDFREKFSAKLKS